MEYRYRLYNYATVRVEPQRTMADRGSTQLKNSRRLLGSLRSLETTTVTIVIRVARCDCQFLSENKIVQRRILSEYLVSI